MIEMRRIADPTLLVVTLVYGLALVTARSVGLFGIGLAVLVLLSVWRYGYEVLRTAAQGRAHLPAPGIETMNPVGEIGLVLHFVFFASLAWLLANPPVADGSPLRPAAGLALLVVFTAFPGSAALMALTQSLAAALDPRGIVGLIRTLGWRRYGAIPALAAALVLIGIVAGYVAGAILAIPWAVFGVLAVFLATGLSLRAARDVLDIPGEKVPEDEYAEHRQHLEWQTQLDLAYASVRSDLTEQGYRTIRSLVESAGSTDAVYRWVLQKMLAWEDPAHAMAFGAGYVEHLLGENRIHAALELAAHMRDRSGRMPVSGCAAESLAEYARSIGRHRLADELLGD